MKFHAHLIALIFFTANSTAEDMYELGSRAVKEKDYVNIVKYLYAYRTINFQELQEKDSKLLKLIDDNIAIAEEKLRRTEVANNINAIKFKQEKLGIHVRGKEINDLLKSYRAGSDNSTYEPQEDFSSLYEKIESLPINLTDATSENIEQYFLIKSEIKSMNDQQKISPKVIPYLEKQQSIMMRELPKINKAIDN